MPTFVFISFQTSLSRLLVLHSTLLLHSWPLLLLLLLFLVPPSLSDIQAKHDLARRAQMIGSLASALLPFSRWPPCSEDRPWPLDCSVPPITTARPDIIRSNDIIANGAVSS